MRIRRTEDVALIASLATACFPQENTFVQGEAYWVVRNEEETPIGFCIAGRDDEDTARLTLAGVTQYYRGRGLQRRLIQVRERWARKQGCEEVVTYVSKYNGPSLVNLLRAGYRIEPEDEDESHFIQLRKKL